VSDLGRPDERHTMKRFELVEEHSGGSGRVR
jgi:hypothetical protein